MNHVGYLDAGVVVDIEYYGKFVISFMSQFDTKTICLVPYDGNEQHMYSGDVVSIADIGRLVVIDAEYKYGRLYEIEVIPFLGYYHKEVQYDEAAQDA